MLCYAAPLLTHFIAHVTVTAHSTACLVPTALRHVRTVLRVPNYTSTGSLQLPYTLAFNQSLCGVRPRVNVSAHMIGKFGVTCILLSSLPQAQTLRNAPYRGPHICASRHALHPSTPTSNQTHLYGVA
jgi:hypothetical protein